MFIPIAPDTWVNSENVLLIKRTSNGLDMVMEDGSIYHSFLPVETFINDVNSKETIANMIKSQEVRL